MYIEKVLDLWVQLMKKHKKCCIYNFIQYIHPSIHPVIFIYIEAAFSADDTVF